MPVVNAITQPESGSPSGSNPTLAEAINPAAVELGNANIPVGVGVPA